MATVRIYPSGGTFPGLYSPGGYDEGAPRYPRVRNPYRDLIRNTQNLLSFWRLNETASGNPATAADSGPGALGLNYYTVGTGPTLVGQAGLVADEDDFSMTMQGGGASFIQPGAGSTPHSFVGTQQFTLELWTRLTSFPGYTMRFFSKRGSDANGLQGYELTATSTLTFARFLNGASINVSASPAAWLPGRPHHIAVTYDGTNSRLYFDGALIGTGPTDTNGMLASGALAVGRFNGGGNQYTGAINNVAMYTRALPASEILTHYQVGTGSLSNPTPYSAVLIAGSNGQLSSLISAGSGRPVDLDDVPASDRPYADAMLRDAGI